LVAQRVDRPDGSGPIGGRTVLFAVRPVVEPAALGLTPRQYAALCAVADGASVRVAARRLNVSPHTLATHLRDAYAVLGVSGRLAAINVLRQRGLLPGGIG
jgi:DNA-binding CsgD family transcriptional regulator